MNRELKTRRHTTSRAALVSTAMLFAAAASAQAPPRTIALEHVTVIDGTGRPPRSDVTVLIEGERIRAIGPWGEVTLPDGATMVDGRGRVVIPGLWDMHAHLAKTGESSLGVMLANGITGVRDMGGDFATVGKWRTEIGTGLRLGPRIVTPGPILESADNVARMLREGTVEPVRRFRVPVSDPVSATRAVDSIAALGVNFLKVRTVASQEAYAALAAAARRHGLALVGHPVAPLADMLNAAQRSIEHSVIVQLMALPDSAQDQAVAQLVARGVAFVPTVVVGAESLTIPDALARALVSDTGARVNPLRRHIGGYLLEDWREQVAERRQEPPFDYDRIAPRVLGVLRRVRAAGATIMPGTDAAVAFIYPGYSLHRELELLVRDLGMTPMEAIVSATSKPAQFLGLDRDAGTIEPGKLADLVLLGADPLTDIRNTRAIVGVMARGRWHDRQALDRMLAGRPD